MSELLVAVAQSGDRQAFALLFQYYAPRLKTYMRKLGTEDAVAEELAQEAMLAVWRKAASFDPGRANAGTWIFAVARNLRIDMLRKEKRPEIDLDDPELVPDPAPRADEVMATQQSESRVRAAMCGLSAEQTEVVTLSFYEDTPHAEIAARLKIPLGTVKSRLRLAMKRIRSELGDDQP
ncbi:RNA polymerase subunit sigma [Paramagnetospirillum marisnigri]|uniref:RNA polymerase sigma factor n=2 Tax=Paramagnetospirillum marisnigri TaxID=1285242 RepID=A0A178MSF3_9PROT|nr:RNA polymerase subunit sigma [Paramagnetospirillum marisnigri]